MGIIEAKDLVHEYIIRDEEGNVESIRTALDHMDLSVEAGQFIAVLGHNGSGKSTFAKHLNALLTPSEGTLIVDGMDVSDESLTYDIRQEAGMVFQNPDNQIIASVVEEDVGFGPENIGVPTEEIWTRVNQSLEAVDMGKYRKHSPNKLSGGQKQRVAIARALAISPKILLLDEPAAGMNPNETHELLLFVKKLNAEGLTVVVIEHDLKFIMNVCDHIMVLNYGQKLCEGNAQEIQNNKQVQEAYFGKRAGLGGTEG